MSEEITKDFEKIAPKRWKRYPLYKDSGIEWIGEIPKGWKVTKLKWLSTEPLKYGLNEPASESNQNDPRYVRITDITDEGILRDDTFKSIPQDIAKGYLLEEGDLLFARSGATVGKTFIYNHSWGVCCFAGYLIRFRANASKVSARYLYYFTKSSAYWNWLNSSFTKSTIQNASADKYKSLPVSVPNIESQREVLNFLDESCKRIDSLISKKQRLIELLKEKRAAIISRAVTKGLDPNAPMKDSGVEWIGEIPTNWRIFRLKDLARINPSKTEINHLADDLEVSFVPMESIGEYGGISGAEVKKLLDVKQGYTYFAEGDLIVAKITPCFENYKGAIASDLLNGIGFGTTELFVLRPNERVDLRYLFYVSISKAFRQTGSNMMQGAAGQKRITADFVNNYPVALPRPEEQRNIARSLEKGTEKIDSFISKIEKSIELLKEYRSALITAAVTGKIDVREEVP